VVKPFRRGRRIPLRTFVTLKVSSVGWFEPPELHAWEDSCRAISHIAPPHIQPTLLHIKRSRRGEERVLDFFIDQKRRTQMSKLPPVPPDQRSPKGPGSDPDVSKEEETPSNDRNLREQGRQGNIYQNTHNQGHQQDR
jgi:hypothetical protein